MKDIKFKYYYKHKRDGDIQTEIFTLEQIEAFNSLLLSDYLREDGYECIDKAISTGLFDKNKVEIFIGDIVNGLLVYPQNSDGTLPTKGVIEYCEGYGAFGIQNDAGLTLFHNHLISTFEIVGHIHNQVQKVKCTDCIHLGVYNTGFDEYPPCASLPKCNKGHWHDCPEQELQQEIECKDFSNNKAE